MVLFVCLFPKFFFHALSLLLNSDSPVSPLQRRLAVQAAEPAAAGTGSSSDSEKNAKHVQALLFSSFFLLVFDFSDFFAFGSPVH